MSLAYPNYFIFLDDDDEIFYGAKFTNDFREYENAVSNLDIVGLWKDKPEPFDLDKALAGSSVMLRNGSKANILKQIKDTLIGYFDECSPFSWDINGDASLAANSNHDIIGMWKDPEPESETVTLTLPCPLKEPKNEMWLISNICTVCKSSYKGNEIYNSSQDKERFEAGFYFGSKEDAEAWLDAMKKNRR